MESPFVVRPSAVQEGVTGWALRPIGALQTEKRLAHVCWNRSLPSLAAFTCEDGSLHMVDTTHEVHKIQDLLVFQLGIFQCDSIYSEI